MKFSLKHKIPKKLWKKGKSKFLSYRLVEEFGKETKANLSDLIKKYGLK